MSNLTKASRELFKRQPDECFPSLTALSEHCQRQKEACVDRWVPPRSIQTNPVDTGRLMMAAGDDGAFEMNDWSFGQLCRLAGVAKETINRLSPDTAGRAFAETLPRGNKPLQLFTTNDQLRSIHGTGYTRLYNADLLSMVREFAVDFEAPPKGVSGGTGLYAGEQDMFCFMIDPGGWAEINGEAFAPGFYLWNSEVGRRSVGISTFWFQQVCANHIVWDATEVVEFTRKHTSRVHDSLGDIRQIIETLVEKRDQRRDGFVRVIEKAMETRLGDDAEEVQKVLSRSGITQQLAKRAIEYARQRGALTIFAMVDALTRFAHELRYAGDRTVANQKAAGLLALAV